MEGFDMIFRYTRADAVRDGLLVDVSATARESGFMIPVAVTAAVFQTYVRVPPGVTAQDEAGRLWDILWMLRGAVKRSPGPGGDSLAFTVLVRNDNAAPRPVRLKAVCHPGDSGEPVITVLLPGED